LQGLIRQFSPPAMLFPVNKCLDYCAMGSPELMETFCRQHTVAGTLDRKRCWEAVSDLEAGDTASCGSKCLAIANNWGK
jgi:hypothetical protein